MFIDDPALEEWMNFKNPPNVEFNVYILMLGITGGVTCYIWEVPYLYVNVQPEFPFLSLVYFVG